MQNTKSETEKKDLANDKPLTNLLHKLQCKT